MQTQVKDNQEDTRLIEVELEVEEMEEVIAPRIAFNHNETLASDDVVLDIEELEEVIAPGIRLTNHNETLVADATQTKPGLSGIPSSMIGN